MKKIIGRIVFVLMIFALIACVIGMLLGGTMGITGTTPTGEQESPISFGGGVGLIFGAFAVAIIGAVVLKCVNATFNISAREQAARNAANGVFFLVTGILFILAALFILIGGLFSVDAVDGTGIMSGVGGGFLFVFFGEGAMGFVFALGMIMGAVFSFITGILCLAVAGSKFRLLKKQKNSGGKG